MWHARVKKEKPLVSAGGSLNREVSGHRRENVGTVGCSDRWSPDHLMSINVQNSFFNFQSTGCPVHESKKRKCGRTLTLSSGFTSLKRRKEVLEGKHENKSEKETGRIKSTVT